MDETTLVGKSAGVDGDKTMSETLNELDLQQFWGDFERYRHSLNRSVIYTAGVQHLAEHGGAYWLIDAIASYLTNAYLRPVVAEYPRVEALHFWRLTVAEDRTAVLEARADSPCKPFVRQEIGFTDFSFASADSWASFDGEHWTLYLPSEH